MASPSGMKMHGFLASQPEKPDWGYKGRCTHGQVPSFRKDISGEPGYIKGASPEDYFSLPPKITPFQKPQLCLQAASTGSEMLLACLLQTALGCWNGPRKAPTAHLDDNSPKRWRKAETLRTSCATPEELSSSCKSTQERMPGHMDILSQRSWNLGWAARNSSLGLFLSGSWCPPAFFHSFPKAFR